MRINLNKLAKEITLLEGKKESLSIGQVKEVLKITFQKLSTFSAEEVESILKKYRR